MRQVKIIGGIETAGDNAPKFEGIPDWIPQIVSCRIRDYIADSTFYAAHNIDSIKVIDIMERPFDEGHQDAHRYHVLVAHKPVDGWDNCSAFQVIFYSNTLQFGDAMFDGMARLNEYRFVSNDIHFGSFTKEMSAEWLGKIEERIKEARGMTEQLKPCLCGADPCNLAVKEDEIGPFIYCARCDAVYTIANGTIEQIIEGWNRRVQE